MISSHICTILYNVVNIVWFHYILFCVWCWTVTIQYKNLRICNNKLIPILFLACIMMVCYRCQIWLYLFWALEPAHMCARVCAHFSKLPCVFFTTLAFSPTPLVFLNPPPIFLQSPAFSPSPPPPPLPRTPYYGTRSRLWWRRPRATLPRNPVSSLRIRAPLVSIRHSVRLILPLFLRDTRISISCNQHQRQINFYLGSLVLTAWGKGFHIVTCVYV